MESMTSSPPAATPPEPSEAPSAPSPRPSSAWWRRWTHYRLLILVALGVALLDQLTKVWIRTHLALGEVWAPWPEPWRRWVRLVHWRNTGAAFGLYQGANDVLLILSILIILFVGWHYRNASPRARCLRWALALQIGGALGNLWDRFTYGWVTDFIAIGRFPVFNIADIAITFGVLCLLWATWREENVVSPRAADAEQASTKEEVRPQPERSSEADVVHDHDQLAT
ncbi:MAG: signal peptidase II [Chloroflexi bacterium]|nr:signal peptidase II [Chloroflexota bacterium]